MEKKRESILNKLYWIRVLLAGLAGLSSAVLYTHEMQTLGLLVPLVLYLASLSVYAFRDSVSIIGRAKAGYHGIGSYIITWLVIYMLALTLILG
ncbi:MAG: hypothetical protein ACP5GH_04975 [Nitrososphaeria archaeon]|jgi:hypothetical protein